MEPLRIGVLGAARISELAIVAPAHATGARLVACAARDPERAKAFAAKHGVERVHASYDDLLADPRVEVIYNPLANALHGPWNVRAARAGKHVLTEKPSASNAAEAAVVRDAVLACGVRFLEGFHYPFHPLFLRVLTLVGDGAIGELRHVSCPMAMPDPGEADPRWSLELAGGAMMDLGCYSLHAGRMLGRFAGGEPRVVSAEAGVRPQGSVEEWMQVELEFPSGATASAGSSMVSPVWDFHLRVVGTKGEIVVPNFVQPHVDDTLIVRTPTGERVEQLGKRSSYTYQLEALAAGLRGGPAPALLVDADAALTQMQLIDDSYRAAGLPLRPSMAG